mmetsp:Transcript_16220/g.42062  ORF Transcript_16220/g.42062 Transcript_16220/m.42062 type:complete len:142 (+) Transcript_16220:792-1217(+)
MLETAGYGVHEIGDMGAADMAVIESSDAVVFCSSARHQLGDPLVTLAQYMVALRRPCVHVIPSVRGLGWIMSLVNGSRGAMPSNERGMMQYDWSADDGGRGILHHLESRDVHPLPCQAAEGGAAAVAAPVPDLRASVASDM